MKKTIFTIIFTLGLMITMHMTSFAYENVDVYVNGEELITDQPAIIY